MPARYNSNNIFDQVLLDISHRPFKLYHSMFLSLDMYAVNSFSPEHVFKMLIPYESLLAKTLEQAV